MVVGLTMAMMAGALVSIQNIFNSKVNERSGSWTTTTLVLGLGFLASLIMGLLFEGQDLFVLSNMRLWYWGSGVIGVGVVVCLVQGIKRLGATFAISIVLTSELGFALLWDSLGWLGLEKVPFTLEQFLGVVIIAGGAIVFKLGGSGQEQQEETTEAA
ncbi:DMT family transporter [Bacillus sp. 2205SS5-2]|uniref:DMT family transporter n=1 Tax=Bacillus sp. 2205SS5-2 TaxID=3109031 RepID=UPI00300686BD